MHARTVMTGIAVALSIAVAGPVPAWAGSAGDTGATPTPGDAQPAATDAGTKPAPPPDVGPEAAPDLPVTSLPAGFELHRPNYILPLTWTNRAHGKSDAELKFQISLKHRIGKTPIYFGYTQVAYLRWLDRQHSRPFREINFNPEFWYRFRPGRLGPDWLGLDLGYEHESNGKDLPGSRSWDRLYARPWFEQGRWRGALKVWYRIPEHGRSSPDNPGGDDNPDILKYYGHHEATLGYTFKDGDWVSVMTRYAFGHRRGAVRIDYAIPTPTYRSYFFFQLFSGYGESLQTYHDDRTRIGIGFALLQ